MFSIGNVLYRLNRTLVRGWELSSHQNVRCAFSNAPHDRVYDHVLVCVDTSQVNLTPTDIQVMHSGQVRVATCAKASTRQHRYATISMDIYTQFPSPENRPHENICLHLQLALQVK